MGCGEVGIMVKLGFRGRSGLVSGSGLGWIEVRLRIEVGVGVRDWVRAVIMGETGPRVGDRDRGEGGRGM